MTNVILHPVTIGSSKEHYLETVRNRIAKKREAVLKLATEEERALLQGHHGDGDLRAWGLTSDGTWKRIQPGDLALFYTGGPDQTYTGRAIVTFSTRNAEIARELWGEDENGKTWEWLYFMRDFDDVEIPVAELNQVAGYEPAFRLRGTTIPAGSAANERIVQEFGLNDEKPGTPRKPTPTSGNESVMEQIHRHFSAALREAGLYYGPDHDQVVRSFLSSFATKPFVILTGLSGSGKTQIATRFGEWLGEDRSALIPVRPDWTGSEATFGYEDVLQPVVDGRRAWHVPRPLQFILEAARNSDAPYLLVLDEMNLAHVERYFADFLSGLESGKGCLPNLRREEDGTWRRDPAGPSLLEMPENLWVVGTVNVDETTYMFSPKVLDRANTFEFRVGTEELSSSFRKPTSCSPANEDLVDALLKIARDNEWHLRNPAGEQEWFASQMRRLHGVLSGGGYEFGHRVFYEMVRFAAMMSSMGEPDRIVALDFQVLQKVLPRLNGSRRELEPTLCAVGRFCYSLEAPDIPEETAFDPMEYDPRQAQLERSFDKVQRMVRKLRANQFVSFTE